MRKYKAFYNETRAINKWGANIAVGKFNWKLIGYYRTKNEAEKALESYVFKKEENKEKRSTKGRRQVNFKLKEDTARKLSVEANASGEAQWEIIEKALKQYWSNNEH